MLAGLRRSLAFCSKITFPVEYAFIGESRTVDVHINRLRRKLGLQNDIQTVYKVGYRLNSAN